MSSITTAQQNLHHDTVTKPRRERGVSGRTALPGVIQHFLSHIFKHRHTHNQQINQQTNQPTNKQTNRQADMRSHHTHIHCNSTRQMPPSSTISAGIFFNSGDLADFTHSFIRFQPPTVTHHTPTAHTPVLDVHSTSPQILCGGDSLTRRRFFHFFSFHFPIPPLSTVCHISPFISPTVFSNKYKRLRAK